MGGGRGGGGTAPDRKLMRGSRWWAVACEPPELADYRDGLTKRQVIMELTEEAWKVGRAVAAHRVLAG